MVENLRKNKETYKGNLYDNLNKKCQEIYVPPGMVKVSEKHSSYYDKEVKVSNEIRLAQPSDKIQLRKYKDDKGGASSKLIPNQSSLKTNSSVALSKQQQKQKEQDDKKHKAEKAREFEVAMQATDANTLDFKEVFQDNLPTRAIELEQFVKTFGKDATNDDRTAKILKQAEKNKMRVYNLLPDDTEIHVAIMVDDMIKVPEKYQTVFTKHSD